MDNLKENNSEIVESYPHNGNILLRFLLDNKINRSAIARKMNISTSTMYQYAESPSLQLSILWKVSMATKHNFIAELGERLPVEYVSKRESELIKQLDDVKSELEKVKFELAVYKNIVGK
ncbi:MAG TPA: hypothetical protein P5084_12520 [Paludibacter sp.]|nr:hypothetical protein [Paludibacter sp.]